MNATEAREALAAEAEGIARLQAARAVKTIRLVLADRRRA